MSLAIAPLRRRLAQAGLALALLCSPTWLLAQASSVPLGQADAGRWLSRLRQAADNSSYRGTLSYRVGGALSLSRVAHYCDGKQRLEKAELLDGQARVRYRHNDQLVTVWPGRSLAVVESRDRLAEFPGLPNAPGLDMFESYELHRVGHERIAGHQAEVVLLKPRDGHRFAQRLWTDLDSGLLLRGDLLGDHGEVLESSAFTDLQMVSKPQPEALLQAMKRLEGLRVLRPLAVKSQLEAEGWRMNRSVPGFQLVHCSKGPLDAAADGPPLDVLQTVFSDGLASVSVFIERFDASRHKRAMRMMLGATHTLMHRQGDWWITIVGEVPMATVLQFDAALERRR